MRGYCFESVGRAARIRQFVDDRGSGRRATRGRQKFFPHGRGWRRAGQRELIPGAHRTEFEGLGGLNLVKALNHATNTDGSENRQHRLVALAGLEFRPLDQNVASERRHADGAGDRGQRRSEGAPGTRRDIGLDRPRSEHTCG